MKRHSPTSFGQALVSPCLPAELLLQIIQQLPFSDGKLIATLRNAHPRLHDLFRSYERSITTIFIHRELRHARTDFTCNGMPDLDWLAACVRKYDVVDDIMDALCSTKNCCAVRRHNFSLANAGLLLLYRLTTFGEPNAKIAYIETMQRDPLLAIYHVIYHATLTARYNGSGWIHQRNYGRFMDANQLSVRNQLEFCYAEATLNIGPDFVSDMLLHHDTSNAEAILMNFYHEREDRDENLSCWSHGAGEFEPPRTQGPRKQLALQGRSLFTVLLERMANIMDCPLEEARYRMELHTDMKHHPLAYLNLRGKARLMQGFNLESEG